MYHEINETAARAAHDANSCRAFKPGKATDGYRAQVDEAARIAEEHKKRVDPMHHERIDGLLAAYSRKLAAWHNRHFEIEARVPSIMIAGGSNFPVAKKHKQNAAREKHMEEYNEIKKLLHKISGTGTAGVSSDDPDAIGKLERKLEGLEANQAEMKSRNAHYRKHKTMKGYPGMSDSAAEHLDSGIKNGCSWQQCPYPSYKLTNNNATIRQTRERIAQLKRKAEKAAAAANLPEGEFDGFEFNGGRVLRNHAENRLQILFDEKPEASKKPEDIRRYRIINYLYVNVNQMSILEVAEVENIDQRTVYRDRDIAYERLAALFFGIDGMQRRR